MYVIATVICPNFHFSVSPHVPFLNLLFEQIANSNEYLLAKFWKKTAKNSAVFNGNFETRERFQSGAKECIV